MYEFREVTQFKQDNRERSDELQINGQTLSSQIEDYTQLSVSGRGIVGNTVTRETVPLADGEWYNYHQATSRALVVRYHLKATSSQALRQQYFILNQILTSDTLLDITFKDELDWHYYGVLQNVGTDPEESLEVVDSFELYCPDPWKYTAKQTGYQVALRSQYAVLPTSLTIPLSPNISYDEIVVSCRDQTIRLIGSYPYANGDRVMIYYRSDHIEILHGNIDKTTTLARYSIPELFFLRHGDTVSAVLKHGNNTETKKVLVEWRDRAK